MSEQPAPARATVGRPIERVSVVIPCYNAAPYLAEAIASVRAQSRAVDEIIVVDDNSSDDSVAIATALGARVLRHEQNLGPSSARNRGIRASSGDVILLLDGDDYWEPDNCATLVGLLEAQPSADVAFGLVRIFTTDSSSVWDASIPEGQAADAFWPSVEQLVVHQSAVAIRRDVFDRTGYYDESLRYAEDYEIFLRLAHRHLFVCVHRVTAHYRKHTAGLSHDRERWWQAEYQVRYRYWQSVAAEPQFCAALAEAIRSAWVRHLSNAWDERSSAQMRLFLSLEEWVPDASTIARRWQRWARLLGAARALDRMPPVMQRLLRSGIGMVDRAPIRASSDQRS